MENNKDFKKQDGGALWLSDYVDKNGNKYYTGNITKNGTEYKISMFPAFEKTNEKAPDFKIVFNTPKEVVKESVSPYDMVKEDPYVNFGESAEKQILEDSLPF